MVVPRARDTLDTLVLRPAPAARWTLDPPLSGGTGPPRIPHFRHDPRHVVITLTGFTAASRPYENTVSVHPMERFLSRCGRASANGLLRQLHPSTAARVLSACLGAVLCTGPVAPAGVSSINGASILGEVSGGADLN